MTKRWLVLGLIWQLIKMYLFKQITISQVNNQHNHDDDDDDDDDVDVSNMMVIIKMYHFKQINFN